MRKIVFALTTVLLMVCLIESIFQVSIVAANFLPAPSIEIVHPSYWQPYQSNLLTGQIDARVLDNSAQIISVSYSLDDKPYVCLTNLTRSNNVTFGPSGYGYVVSAIFILDNLSEGNHTLRAYSLDASGKNMSTFTQFSVDTNYWSPYVWDKQKVLLLSPENKTYSSSNMPLVFVMNGEIQRAYYFLDSDGREPINVAGNITLTGLSRGSHRIYISAHTELGGWATQAAIFNIGQGNDDNSDAKINDNPSTGDNQTSILVIAITALTIIAILAVILYKRKKSMIASKQSFL